MPKFNNREEYEQWKAERIKQTAQRAAGPDASGEKDQPQAEAPGIERPSPVIPGNLSAIGDLFSRTWSVYKERFWTLIVLCLLMVILFILPIAIIGGGGYALAMVLPDLKIVLIGISLAIGITLSMVTLFWGISALLCAVTDDTLSVGRALGKGWPRVWGLMWLLSILGFLTTGGYLLFFIPGILFTVWFIFGQFIFIEDNDRGMRALLKSKEFVKGYGFDVFARLFLVWLISTVLGIIPLAGPVLSFLFVPFGMILSYILYQELKTIKGSVSFSDSVGEKFKWLATATLGYILVPVIIITLFSASLLSSLHLLRGFGIP